MAFINNTTHKHYTEAEPEMYWLKGVHTNNLEGLTTLLTLFQTPRHSRHPSQQCLT